MRESNSEDMGGGGYELGEENGVLVGLKATSKLLSSRMLSYIKVYYYVTVELSAM